MKTGERSPDAAHFADQAARPVLGTRPIMPAMCATCPWQTNGQAARLAEGRLERMEASLRAGETHNCHSVGPRGTVRKGETHTCRGSVNYMASVGIHDETDRILAIMIAVDGQNNSPSPDRGQEDR